jgi:hypothetical protein
MVFSSALPILVIVRLRLVPAEPFGEAGSNRSNLAFLFPTLQNLR